MFSVEVFFLSIFIAFWEFCQINNKKNVTLQATQMLSNKDSTLHSTCNEAKNPFNQLFTANTKTFPQTINCVINSTSTFFLNTPEVANHDSCPSICHAIHRNPSGSGSYRQLAFNRGFSCSREDTSESPTRPCSWPVQ